MATPVRPRPQQGLNVIQPNANNAAQGSVGNTTGSLQGIKKPTDLRSNVKDQTLNIPNFLKRELE
jgi:hypothetical protein